VIATPVGAIPELVLPAYPAGLLPEISAPALAEAMARHLALWEKGAFGPALQHDLRQFVLANYTLEIGAGRFRQAYEAPEP